MSSRPPERRSALQGLDDLLAEAEAEVSRRDGLAKAPQGKQAAIPFTAQPTPSVRDRRSDLTIAALGITLGLICALFPWYIFFNPDEFGVRAIKFGGEGDAISQRAPLVLAPKADRIGAPSNAELPPVADLDLMSTGTTTHEPKEEEKGTKGLTAQPFPTAPIAFRVVYVANGRAMVEDDTGLFVVQRGSLLPDASSVTAIEQRDGHWVVLTSSAQVLEVTP